MQPPHHAARMEDDGGTVLGSITLAITAVGKRWPPWPSRKRDRRSMRLEHHNRREDHGLRISDCSELEHAMDFRTKILPSHADRAAIFRLSWHVFLVCAFAIMTVLAWATLRQALGGELDTTGAQESRALQMPTQATRMRLVNAA
jgi:hypothetical protein